MGAHLSGAVQTQSCAVVGPVTRLRPDETFYSWMARISQAFGGLDPWTLRAMLFGGELARFYPDLASGLDAFVTSSRQTDLSVEELAIATTTYGYFANFLDEPGRTKLIAHMGPTWVYPHHGTGCHQRWSRVLALRYCPDCHAQMDALCGNRWWRRAHQLPTSYRCPDHDSSLRESLIPWRDMKARFEIPTPANCPDRQDCIGETPDEQTRSLLGAMARHGRACLEAVAYSPPEAWSRFYQSAVRDLGLSTESNSGLVTEVHVLLAPCLSPAANSGFLPFVDLGSRSWLHRLLLGSGPASPMEHVLLRASLETFFGTPAEPEGWQVDTRSEAFWVAVKAQLAEFEQGRSR